MVAVHAVTDIFVNAERQLGGEKALAALEVGKGKNLNASQAKTAAQEFESMFLAQMLSALKPEESDSESLFNSKESDEIFRTMMMEQYAKEISKAGGIGIASYIERELLGQQSVAPSPKHIPAQWQSLIDNYVPTPADAPQLDTQL